MPNFRLIEHTADVFVEGSGKTLEEAFEGAALGMTEVMTNTKKVKPKIKKTIKIKSNDLKSLLYDFLEQFIILKDAEDLVFSKFKVKKIRKNKIYSLEAEAWGEEFNPKKHESRTHVKAVTYHEMEIKEEQNKKTIKVLLDI